MIKTTLQQVRAVVTSATPESPRLILTMVRGGEPGKDGVVPEPPVDLSVLFENALA